MWNSIPKLDWSQPVCIILQKIPFPYNWPAHKCCHVLTRTIPQERSRWKAEGLSNFTLLLLRNSWICYSKKLQLYTTEHETLLHSCSAVFSHLSYPMTCVGCDPWSWLIEQFQEDYRSKTLPTPRRSESSGLRSWFTSPKSYYRPITTFRRPGNLPSLTEVLNYQTGEGLEKPSIPAPRPPPVDDEEHYAIPPSHRMPTLSEVSLSLSRVTKDLLPWQLDMLPWLLDLLPWQL